MKRLLARGGAACVLLTLLACGGSGSDVPPAPQFAIVLPAENPAWIAYQVADAAGDDVPEVEPARYLPDALAHARGVAPRPQPAPPLENAFCDFPPVYDLRALGRSTPAWGNDCPCGWCWTYAVIASIESSLTPWGLRNLSENHVQLASWEGAKCNKGGTALVPEPYLAAWQGPVDEADFDACSGVRLGEIPRLPERAHVQSVVLLPDRRGPLDNCWIKWAVTNLGGVYASSNLSGYAVTLDTDNTHYDPAPDVTVHAVTIVGWDDTFDRNRFYCSRPDLGPDEHVPPGDGAFIVKDDTGPDQFEQGHWYVSYYDGSIAKTAVAFVAEPLGMLSRVYQWDPDGVFDTCVGLSLDGYHLVSWQANVFTAKSDEYLAAVSVAEVSSYDADYHVRVYVDPVNGPTAPGGPVAEFDVSLPTRGYFTFRLPAKVPLHAGQRFAVAVRGVDRLDGQPTLLAVERPPLPGSKVTAGPGQSFLSVDGVTWSDVDTLAKTLQQLADTNVRIKAFTTPSVASTAHLDVGDLSVVWDLENDGPNAATVRPIARRQAKRDFGFEPVGDEIPAVRYGDGSGPDVESPDGWIPLPAGAHVTAVSAAGAYGDGEQIVWRVDVQDVGVENVVLPGREHPLNDLLVETVAVVAVDPADGAEIGDARVDAVTLSFDRPVTVGPGLRSLRLDCASEVKVLLPAVGGRELRIVPTTPCTARAEDGAGGTTWHLVVPSDAVLSEDSGAPMAGDLHTTFVVHAAP